MAASLLPAFCFFSPLFVAVLAPLLDSILGKRLPLLVIIGTSLSFISALLMIPHVIFSGIILQSPILPFQVNSTNIATLVGVALISFLSAIYNALSEGGGRLKPFLYNFFLLFFVSAMLGLTMSYDIFVIFILAETTTLVSIMLVTHSHGKFPLQAAFKYLIITGIGAVFVLVGVTIIYELTETTILLEIVDNPGQLLDNPKFLLLSAACFIIGLGADIGVAPFHGWMPDVYPASTPTVNSFRCAKSIALVFTLYKLVHSLYVIYPSSTIIFLMGGVGVFSITLGVLLAYRQKDFMRMAAYFSIEDYGHLTLAYGLFTPLSFIAGQMYLINTALMEMGVLQTLGLVYLRSHTFNMDTLGGLIERMKKTAWSYILCAFSLVGIPPLSGFFAKWLLYSAVFDFLSRHSSLAVSVSAIIFLLGASLISLTFFIRSFQRVFLGKSTDITKKMDEDPPLTCLSPVISAVAAILIGVQPQILLGLIGAS